MRQRTLLNLGRHFDIDREHWPLLCQRATHRWRRERSAAGELLGVDFETTGVMRLYRASDDGSVPLRRPVSSPFDVTGSRPPYDL